MSQEQFEQYRRTYETLEYRSFETEVSDGALKVVYHFEILKLACFRSRWEFPLPGADGAEALGWRLPPSGNPEEDPILRRLLFSLGMVEAISYYKAVCPRTVRISCGPLSGWQQEWWRKLYYKGLGEFRYRNGIEADEEEFVRFECDGAETEAEAGTPLSDPRAYAGVLVPVGGGKDSVVSLELLRGEDITTYAVNGNETTRNVIALCDHKRGEYTARRILDKQILSLNERGFLNGHIPFSAVVAFSAVLAAYLGGFSKVALSNETSANETTVPDSDVNHQYSKSFEFERDFQAYFRTLTDSDIAYFSLLRPLTELQIAAIFAGERKYHGAFRSCNRGSREGIWCCSCPKCLFVNIILRPFLGEGELRSIFGESLLDKESLEPDFRELIGIEPNKPFECVGTRREVCACLADDLARGKHSLLTDRYADYVNSKSHPGEVAELLGEWCDEHAVPEPYIRYIRERVRQVSRGGRIPNEGA